MISQESLLSSKPKLRYERYPSEKDGRREHRRPSLLFSD